VEKSVADQEEARQESSPAELEARASADELHEVTQLMGRAEDFVREQLREGARYPRDVEAAHDGLPEAAVSLAFWRLVNRREVELGADRMARLAETEGDEAPPSSS
jgi:hypothetical protein